jgi:N-acetylneuraminate lyase
MFESGIAKKLGGVYAATFTPFNKMGQVAPGTLVQLINFLLEKKVRGNYVCGSTGEGILMSLEERKLVAEVAVEVSAGRGKVIVHIGALATRDAVLLAKHATDIGADGISAIPPIFLTDGFDSVLYHYEAIAAASGIPFIIYNIPGRSGFTMTLPQICRLAEIQGIAGIKFTDTDLFLLQLIVREFGDDFVVFNGHDPMLIGGLSLGAHGGIGSTYNLFPEHYAEIYKNALAGNWDQAREWQFSANEFTAELLKGKGLAICKYAMKWHGIDCGDVRAPLTMPEVDALEANLPLFKKVLGFKPAGKK